MRGETQLLSARAVRWLDVGVVVWIVVWAALGVLTWHDIRSQMQLTSDVIKVGTAVRDTGRALGVVGSLPLIGGSIGDFAGKIETLGNEVLTSGQSSRAGIGQVAVVAGVAVGVLPAALVLFLYLPVRVRWRRQVKAIADSLPAFAGDPGFEQYLARRAVDALPWDTLYGLSKDPWRAIANGDFRAFADAELARLGLKRPGG